jgi:hypothetical protein
MHGMEIPRNVVQYNWKSYVTLLTLHHSLRVHPFDSDIHLLQINLLLQRYWLDSHHIANSRALFFVVSHIFSVLKTVTHTNVIC